MLKNMKIGARLFILMGILSILLITVGVLGLMGERETDARLETVYNDRLIPIALLAQMNNLRQDSLHQILLARLHDPKLPESKMHEADHPITKHTDIVAANQEKNNKLWEQYMATYLTPEERKLAESYAAQRGKYRSEGLDPAIVLLKERRFDEASLYVTSKTLPLYKESEHSLDALVQLQVDVAKSEKDKADDNYARTRNLTITSIVGGILLVLGTGFWIIRGITGRLAESMSALSSTSSQIASTLAQHEKTAANQSAAVNETSATVEELGASSRQSAEQAGSAATLAQKAMESTKDGKQRVKEAVDGMGHLKEKVGAVAGHTLKLGEQIEQINKIANIVKDLLGQINMLALNAAVEAARAGEHGKGFAVVAGEVRKLADQSKKSAEQANTIIGEIQRSANATIMATEEGSKSAEEVIKLAKMVDDLFGSLSTTADTVYQNAQQVMLNARQQSAAVSQIVEAINTVNLGAKETAAGITQTKTGVERLNETAGSLKAMV